MRSTDPKAGKIPDNQRRAITIHDGARLTPGLLAMLSAISDAAEQAIEAYVDESTDETSRPYQYRSARKDGRNLLRPTIIARADGLAIYSSRRVL